MDFTNYTREALDKYFRFLMFGEIKSNNIINNLIVLSFIEELLTTQLSFNITEEDYNYIINFLYCIAGKSCIISLPTFEVYDSTYHDIKGNLAPRTTEDNILRKTENEILRQKA